MDLEQALRITKEHIRIGKGMELTNGVPEALETLLFAEEFLRKENKRLLEVLEYISNTEHCRYKEKMQMTSFKEGFRFDMARFKKENPVCNCPKCIADEALRIEDKLKEVWKKGASE